MGPRNPTVLAHNKPRVTSHLGFIYRDDCLCAGEFFLVVIREMALGQFPITEFGRAGYKPRGCRSLYFLHDNFEHSTVSTPGLSQVLLCLGR